MYRVTVMTEGREYLLHDPRDEELRLVEPVVTLEMGKNGGFTFLLPPDHPNRDKILPLKSEIRVYRDDEIIFCGRRIGAQSDLCNLEEVTCEGELAYLLDSIQRPYEFTGTAAEFFKKLLDVHNGQVEEKKRFEPGDVTASGAAAKLSRTGEECENTLKVMKSQLTEKNGGYIRVRRSGGKKYLDYVDDYGEVNSQVIRFGENLLDLSRHTSPEGIITALIPYGAAVESGDSDEEERPLTIEGVNGGKDYVYDQEAVNTYGWIWGTRTFEDVTQPEALLAKGKAYLGECIALPVTLELNALDMSVIDVDMERMRLGCWTRVESAPHGVAKNFLLSKQTIHLDDPGKDEITLGRTLVTFTGASNKEQAEISDRIDRVSSSASREINRKVENATQLITGGKGGYFVISLAEDGHPEETLWMDTPDKETARHVLRANKNGIGFSRTGIGGPYENAWTIDGNLVADFITTGTMLADRIRGGSLEVGGAGPGRDGEIRVLNSRGNAIGVFNSSGITINQGRINGPAIVGGTAEFGDGLFTAEDEAVSLGGFEARYDWGREIFQSSDQRCGISAASSKKGGLWAWFGWNSASDFDAVINNLGQVVARDFVVHGKFALRGKIEEIEDRLNRLESGGEK